MNPPSFLRFLEPGRAGVIHGALLLVLWLSSVGCQSQRPNSHVVVAAGDGPLITREPFRARLRKQAPHCVGNREGACAALKRQILVRMIEEALFPRGPRAGCGDPQNAVQGGRGGARPSARWGLGRPGAGAVRAGGLARIKKGEDFARLAKTHSLSPEAAQGGDMGVLGPAQMPPELAEAAFSLEAGQTNEVVPSAYGFHMVGVEEQRAPRKIEFSETAAEIRRRPLGEKLQRSYAA